MSRKPPFDRSLYEDLVAYLDGELPQARRAEIEACLREDAALAEEVELHRRTWEALASLPGARASQAFVQRTMEHVRRTETRRRRRRWTGAVAGLAACAAAVIVAVALWPTSTPETVPTVAEQVDPMVAEHFDSLAVLQEHLSHVKEGQDRTVSARIADELAFVEGLVAERILEEAPVD